jgi:DNA-nicking Smr family endonuclease
LSEWDFEIEGIKPIKSKAKISPVPKRFDANKVRKRQEQEVGIVQESYIPSAGLNYEFILPHDLSRLDKNLQLKFRNGELNIQKRLDLHGMTLEKGYKEFISFMRSALESNSRMLLIITGKGGEAPKIGKLKENFPKWVNMPEIQPHLLAYTNATPRHGGDGAWYVLLKRKRIS